MHFIIKRYLHINIITSIIQSSLENYYIYIHFHLNLNLKKYKDGNYESF